MRLVSHCVILLWSAFEHCSEFALYKFILLIIILIIIILIWREPRYPRGQVIRIDTNLYPIPMAWTPSSTVGFRNIDMLLQYSIVSFIRNKNIRNKI